MSGPPDVIGDHGDHGEATQEVETKITPVPAIAPCDQSATPEREISLSHDVPGASIITDVPPLGPD